MQIKLNLFVEAMQDAPVIAAVKNDEGLDRALSSGCTVVFLLYGTILNIGELVRRVKEAGKLAFIHIDLIEGMSARDISAEYIASRTEADGVISTHPNLIRRARELGLLTIQRFFMLDSLSFANVLRQSSNADVVDVLPGAIPSVISHLVREVRQRAAAGQIRCGGGLVRRGGGGVHYQRETMVRMRATGASADIMATKSSYSALRTKTTECYWIISIY